MISPRGHGNRWKVIGATTAVVGLLVVSIAISLARTPEAARNVRICQDQETMVSCLIVCSMSHFDDFYIYFYVLQNRPSRQRFRIVAHSRSFTVACVPLISNSPGFPSEIHHRQRAMLMSGS